MGAEFTYPNNGSIGFDPQPSGRGSKPMVRPWSGNPPQVWQLSFYFLGVTSPFFPGILLSGKPPKTLGKWRSVFEKNDG